MRYMALAFLVALGGCGSDTRTIGSTGADTGVQQDGQTADMGISPDAEPGNGGCTSVVESFTQEDQRRVDILLMIDPSGSMMDETPRLLATATQFAQNAVEQGANFHLGMVSIAPPQDDSPLGLLLGEPPYIKSADLSQNPTDYIAEEFEKRVELASTYGMGTELGFDALLNAFSQALTQQVSADCNDCSAPNVCHGSACYAANHGFRRADAALEILFFTDEDDGSSATLEDTVAFLSLQNPGSGRSARVHALLPQTCTSDTFPRYNGLVTATGGATHDLCAEDYGPAIEALTEQVFGLQQQFKLKTAPEAETIQVQVDDQAVTFTFDLPSRTVLLDQVPAVGSTITVSYCQQ